MDQTNCSTVGQLQEIGSRNGDFMGSLHFYAQPHAEEICHYDGCLVHCPAVDSA